MSKNYRDISFYCIVPEQLHSTLVHATCFPIYNDTLSVSEIGSFFVIKKPNKLKILTNK